MQSHATEWHAFSFLCVRNTQKTYKSVIDTSFFSQRSLAAGKGTVGAFGTRSGSLVLLEKHTSDVSATRICSETAHIGIPLPLCFRNNS